MPVSRLAGAAFSAALSNSRSLQRTNTLLEYPKNKQRLQLALVIDGTDTMGDDIQSLSEHLQGLVASLENAGSAQRPGSVSVAVVVFRDTESPSGATSIPISKFTNDPGKIKQVLASIRPETGKPNYRERVDEGLDAALSQLDWLPAADETAERWVIFCGDAPAYPEEHRKHSDDALVKMAVEKNIHLCFVLCSSGASSPVLNAEKLKIAVEKERPDLEAFAAVMAKKTGGTVLDTGKLHSADFWCEATVTLDPITQSDIVNVRQQQGKDGAVGDVVRVAVLPHSPLGEMLFTPSSRDEILVARQIAEALKKVPGFFVETAIAAEQEYKRAVKNANVETLQSVQGQSSLIHEIAKGLNVEYVIWGDLKVVDETVLLESRLYKGGGGRMIASSHPQDASQRGEEAVRDLPSLTLRLLCRKAAVEFRKGNVKIDPTVLAVFERVNADEQARRSVVSPLARDHRAQRAMLIGLEHLERSLQVVKRSPVASTDPDQDAATENLHASAAQFRQALEFEPKNPLAHLLLANCCVNLGHLDALDDWTVMRNEYLLKANEYVDLLDKDDPARTEIQAEYALLVNKDYKRAVELYSQLIQDKSQKGGRFGLRAHWMLAGIHLGDWGAISYAPTVLSVSEARQNIIAILAQWPDSPEALFYEKSLGKSKVPAGNGTLATR